MEVRVFDKIRRFLEPAPARVEDPERARTIAATLLVEVAASDHEVAEVESDHIVAALSEQFSLSISAATELVDAARRERRQAPDLTRLSRDLQQHCDVETRRRLVEAMWSVVYADGRVDAVESRLAGAMVHLFGLPEKDLREAREAAAEAAGA